MFIDIRTSLFATYLFLTGDKDALSNWSYLNNPTLTQILAEIELFYMLPFQRRWKEWFPEIIYYYANLYDIQKEVKAMMERKEWNIDAFPELKNDLLKILHIKTDKQNSVN
ncbi:unnamed protein product [Rhizophagus irregularis]|nr:unnamed protein product [Rhizophagus irregularis]